MEKQATVIVVHEERGERRMPYIFKAFVTPLELTHAFSGYKCYVKRYEGVLYHMVSIKNTLQSHSENGGKAYSIKLYNLWHIAVVMFGSRFTVCMIYLLRITCCVDIVR
jgi:hypothetical protein